MGTTYNNLGFAHASELNLNELYTKQAVLTSRALVGIDADTPDYQESLAISLHNLGTVYGKMNRPELGEAALKEAIAVKKRLAGIHPQVPTYQVSLAWSQTNLASILNRAGRCIRTLTFTSP